MKQPEILKSVRIRLILSHLIAIVLVMMLSGFLLLSFLQNYFLQSMEDGLLAQAHITTQVLIPGAIASAPIPENDDVVTQNNLSLQYSVEPQNNLFLYNRLSLHDIVTDTANLAQNNFFTEDVDINFLENASLQMGAQLNTRIRILDKQGKIVIDSAASNEQTSLQNDPLALQALAGKYATQTERVDQQKVMSVAVPAFVNEKLVGVVYLSQPLETVLIVLQALQTRWLLSTIIAVILAGLVALFMSQAITQPLQHLTTLANNLSHQFSTMHTPPATTKSWDEIGQLQQAFDEMAHQLQTSQQMQIDFVANVSHELRTPLTSVKGMVETLQDGAVEDLKVRDRFLDTIAQETDRLIRLVKDLLLLSRADSDGLHLQKQMINLVGLAETTINQIQPQAYGKQVSITQTSNEAELYVPADRDRMQQVLLNLLDNAIKYSPSQTMVTVSVDYYSPESVLVAIKDEGMGIASSQLPHIGERFYRTDKARSRGNGGSGLGLAIARALVEAHQGRLWVESEEGVGTAVYFTLPKSNNQ